jgi:hypothetical protein
VSWQAVSRKACCRGGVPAPTSRPDGRGGTPALHLGSKLAHSHIATEMQSQAPATLGLNSPGGGKQERLKKQLSSH